MTGIALKKGEEITIISKDGYRETRRIAEDTVIAERERVRNELDPWGRVYIVEEIYPIILQEIPRNK